MTSLRQRTSLLFAALLPFILAVPAGAQARPLQVRLVADPNAARTEALRTLLESRFDDVEIAPLTATTTSKRDRVFVFDLPPGGTLPIADRWDAYAEPQAGRFNAPAVFIGTAAREASVAWDLLGAEAGRPVTPGRPTGSLAWPVEDATRLPVDASILGDGHTPLAFALHASPDARVIARSEDADGREVALAWHQGRYASFGPAGPIDTLGDGWRSLLLDVVAFAGRFHGYRDGKPMVATTPGAGALAALREEVTLERHDAPRCRARLGDDLAPLADTRESLRRALTEGAFAWLPGPDGRLQPSADLIARAAGGPEAEHFVASLIADLTHGDVNVRARARRLLARHVTAGPSPDAAPIVWDGWLAEAGETLTFVPAGLVWMADPEANWRPATRADDPTLPASVAAAAATLLAGGISNDRAGLIARRFGTALALPLMDALDAADTAAERDSILTDMRRLDAPLGPVERRLVAWTQAHGEHADRASDVIATLPENQAAGRARIDEPQPATSAVARDAEQEARSAAAAIDAQLSGWLADPDSQARAYAVLANDRHEVGRHLPEVLAHATGSDEVLAIRALAVLDETGDRATQAIAAALQHGSVWQRREAAFTLGSRYLDVRAAQTALLGALSDSDDQVRCFAAWALREPAGDGDRSVAAALDQVADDADARLATIAREASARRAPVIGQRIILCPEGLDPALPWQDIATALARLDDPEASRRHQAARSIAWHGGTALLEELASEDPAVRALADERVARTEDELADWIATLCERMDDEYGPGPATRRLGRLGSLALPALEHELLRPYRFPIGGQSTYMELVHALTTIGPDAWPAVLASLWHWRDHGFTDALPAWHALGDSASIVAPFVAVRFGREVSRAPLDSQATASGSADFRPRWMPLWRSLGSPGRAALSELSTHPDPAVADAAMEALALLEV